MTKEDFQQWAFNVVVSEEMNKEATQAFLKEVEAHDKEAAALARKCVSASSDLAAHLKTKLDDSK